MQTMDSGDKSTVCVHIMYIQPMHNLDLLKTLFCMQVNAVIVTKIHNKRATCNFRAGIFTYKQGM